MTLAVHGTPVGPRQDGSIRETSLVGFGARLYCSWRIGTIEESQPDREVLP